MSNKVHLYIVAALLFVVVAGATAERAVGEGPPVRVVIGASPYLSVTDRAVARTEIFRLILDGVPRGSLIEVYDAYSNSLITSFQIPSKEIYDQPKVRARFLKEKLQHIARFAEIDAAPPAGDEDLLGCVRFPQFLEFIGETSRSNGLRTEVLMLGSPLYIDNRERAFSMVDGYVPTDGHLRVDRSVSVFGVAGKRGLLDGIRVHYAYFGDPWANDVHEYHVKRFWSLLVQELGGELVTFVRDPQAAVQRLTEAGSRDQPRFRIDPSHLKVEMVRTQRTVRRDVDWLLRDDVEEVANGFPVETRGKLKIGIRWDCLDCDLDLYSKPEEGAEELHFRNTRTVRGLYYKDYLTSPNPVHGLEYVEYTTPVELTEVQAAVNFFGGNSSGGAVGEVRILFGGVVYRQKFRIPASHGNQGGESASRSSSNFWTVLDIPAIVGLQSLAAGAERVQPERSVRSTPQRQQWEGWGGAAEAEPGPTMVRVLSPADGDRIYASPTEQGVVIRSIAGDVLGFTSEKISQFGLVVEVSICTSQWYPQGIVRVRDDGTWFLATAHFGGATHTIKAVLKDRHGNQLASTKTEVVLIR